MTRKIFKAISVVTIIVLLATTALIIGVLYNYYTDIQVSQIETQTEFVAEAVEIDGLNYLNNIDNTTYRVTWIASDGSVLFDNKASTNAMENHLEREEVQQALQTGKGTSMRYSTTLMERQFYSAIRLSDDSVIRLSVSQLTWWALLLEMIQPMIIILVFAIGFSFLLAFNISKRIVSPLNEIDLNKPNETEVYEELTPLIRRINTQQTQINSQKTELQRKNEEFNAATMNMSEGIVLLNADGLILSINKAASRLLNISNYCVGKDLLLFSNSFEIQELLRGAFSGKHSEVVMPIENMDYQFNASPIISENKTVGIALIIFDITEKEKAEQIRREFTANVSHELRTPLQTIAGSAELLSNGMVAQEDIPKFSGYIYSESKRLITLVEDIIKLSHLDEDSTELPIEDVNLYDLAKLTVRNLKSVAAEHHIDLILSGEDAVIKGRSQLLSSIIFNLCDNAIKYNKTNGKVNISVKNFENNVELTVSDTGIGIPLEQQDRIFERFYRVDKSHSKEVGGTGLGLSIVKHAAKLHNAEIEVRSILDKGTTIIITFPK